MVDKLLPLQDGQARVSYKDAGINTVPSAADATDVELYLKRLLELVVFKPYLPQDAKWWSAAASQVQAEPGNAAQNMAGSVLDAVVQYQDLSGQKSEYADYAAISEKLKQVLKQAEGQEVLPIMTMVASNYLGLASRMASFKAPDDTARNAVVAQSGEGFRQCSACAEKFDDPTLPLWKGFSLFNLARLELEYGDKAAGLELLAEATEYRSKWLGAALDSPAIEDAFKLEYLYAKAFLLQQQEGLTATGVASAFAEYLAIKPDSEINLAKTVDTEWKKVGEKFTLRSLRDTREIQAEIPVAR